MSTTTDAGMTAEHKHILQHRRMFLMRNIVLSEEFFSLLTKKKILNPEKVEQIKVRMSHYKKQLS